jgi:hypothetical protein
VHAFLRLNHCLHMLHTHTQKYFQLTINLDLLVTFAFCNWHLDVSEAFETQFWDDIKPTWQREITVEHVRKAMDFMMRHVHYVCTLNMFGNSSTYKDTLTVQACKLVCL